MDKSKLNWGLMSGIYPGCKPAGSVTLPDLAVYLKTPLALGDLLATRPDLAVYRQPAWSL